MADVGAGYLAHIEPVARGFELAPQDLLIIDVEIQYSLIADHVQVGRGTVEQNRLLSREQIGALSLDKSLGPLRLRLCAAARVKRLSDAEIDGARLDGNLSMALTGPLPLCLSLTLRIPS